MAYRLELSCADRVRFAEVSAKLGISGADLVQTLLHDFFQRTGVKNPSKRSQNTSVFHHAHKV
jgi:hypothetical protein